MSDVEVEDLGHQDSGHQDSGPCVGCGLCCTGTLHVRAVVTPGEESRLLEYGLELVTHKERTHFRLPCRYQSCGQCTIYEDRFDICRSFRCGLLRRYQAGEIDIAEAREKVERALDLIAEVEADHPGTALYVERDRVRQQLADQLRGLDPTERGPVARSLLRLVALETYLERWFRDKHHKEDEEADRDTSGSNS